MFNLGYLPLPGTAWLLLHCWWIYQSVCGGFCRCRGSNPGAAAGAAHVALWADPPDCHPQQQLFASLLPCAVPAASTAANSSFDGVSEPVRPAASALITAVQILPSGSDRFSGSSHSFYRDASRPYGLGCSCSKASTYTWGDLCRRSAHQRAGTSCQEAQGQANIQAMVPSVV